MTNEDIFDSFETMIDDTLDSTMAASLAEQARIKVEIELKLQVSKKLDTSKTTTAGGTYLTAYALQADVLVPAGQRIYVGNTPYIGIPFEDRMAYKDSSGFWYVDLLNNNLYLTGTQVGGQQITFPYITKGTEISADEADADVTVLKWPNGLHILIPMEMAQIWFAIDQGDKARAWDDRWGAFYKITKNSLIDWDAAWKLAAIGGSTPPSNSGGDNPNAINS
jgi:hypothetical protein